jgi:ubiquitin carboxyl-terminal hydrolase 4/11/15
VFRPCEFERAIPNLKLFGIPFVARLENLYTGFDLHKQYLKLLSPLLMPADDALNDYDDVGITTNEDSTMEDVVSPTISDSNTGTDTGTEDDQCSSSDFQFYLKDGLRSTEIKMNEPLPVPKFSDNLEVYVTWSESMIEKYDTCLLSSLPEVLKPQLYARRPQESVSLYKCLEAFLKEEPLGPEDMWLVCLPPSIITCRFLLEDYSFICHKYAPLAYFFLRIYFGFYICFLCLHVFTYMQYVSV